MYVSDEFCKPAAVQGVNGSIPMLGSLIPLKGGNQTDERHHPPPLKTALALPSEAAVSYTHLTLPTKA